MAYYIKHRLTLVRVLIYQTCYIDMSALNLMLLWLKFYQANTPEGACVVMCCQDSLEGEGEHT